MSLECLCRKSGNTLCHWCVSTRWSWSILEAPACCPTHGTMWTARSSTQELHPLQPLADVLTHSSYKKPVITCRTSRTNSSRTQVTRTSPSCSTRTLLSPTLPLMKLHPAITRGTWFYSWFGDFCGVLSGPPTVTLCSVHVHNVVAKKSAASTDLLPQVE